MVGTPMSKISEPHDNQLDDRPELLDIHIQTSKCCRSTTICEEGRYWRFKFNGAHLARISSFQVFLLPRHDTVSQLPLNAGNFKHPAEG